MSSTINRSLPAIVLLAGFSMHSGCSSVPPPKQELQEATVAVQSARDNGASEYAAVQLRAVEQKFAAAQLLLERAEHTAARRTLQQVAVDAKYAAALARLQLRVAEQQTLQAEINQLQARIQEMETGQ